MLYVGQTHTVSVPVGLDTLDRASIAAAFDTAYRASYGRLLDGIPRRVMNHRTAVIGRRPALDMHRLVTGEGKPPEACQTGTRRLYAGGIWHEAPVYERLALAPGARITGPALLEQSDATIFVDPGLVGETDRFGNLVITAA